MTAAEKRRAAAFALAKARLLQNLQAAAPECRYTCPTWGVDLDGRCYSGYTESLLAALRREGHRIVSDDLNYYRLEGA